MMHQYQPTEQLHGQQQPPVHHQQPQFHQQPPVHHAQSAHQQQQPPVQQQDPIQQQHAPVQQQQAPVQQQQAPVEQLQQTQQQQAAVDQQSQDTIMHHHQHHIHQQQAPNQQQQPPMQQHQGMPQQQQMHVDPSTQHLLQQQQQQQQQIHRVQHQQPPMQQQQPPMQQHPPVQHQQPPSTQQQVPHHPGAEPHPTVGHGQPVYHSPQPSPMPDFHQATHQASPPLQGSHPGAHPAHRPAWRHPPPPPLAERRDPQHQPELAAHHHAPHMHQSTEPPQTAGRPMEVPQPVHTPPGQPRAAQYNHDQEMQMEKWRLEEQRRQQMIEEREWLAKREQQKRAEQMAREEEEEKQRMLAEEKQRKLMEEEERQRMLAEEKQRKLMEEEERQRMLAEEKQRKLMEEEKAQLMEKVDDVVQNGASVGIDTAASGESQEKNVKDQQQLRVDGDIEMDDAYVDDDNEDEPDINIDHHSLGVTPSLQPSPDAVSASITPSASSHHQPQSANTQAPSAADELPLHMQATPNLPQATEPLGDLDITDITQIQAHSALPDQASHTPEPEAASRGMEHLQTLSQPDQMESVNTEPLPIPAAGINDQPPGTENIHGEIKEPLHSEDGDTMQGSSEGDSNNQDSQEHVVNGVPSFNSEESPSQVPGSSSDGSQVPETFSGDIQESHADERPHAASSPTNDATSSSLLQDEKAEDPSLDEDEDSVYQMGVDPAREALFRQVPPFDDDIDYMEGLDEDFDDEWMEEEEEEDEEDEMERSEFEKDNDYDMDGFSDDDASLKIGNVEEDEKEKVNLHQEESIKEDTSHDAAAVDIEPEEENRSEEVPSENILGNNEVKPDVSPEPESEGSDVKDDIALDDHRSEAGVEDAAGQGSAESGQEIVEEKPDVETKTEPKVDDTPPHEPQEPDPQSSDQSIQDVPESQQEVVNDDILSVIDTQPTEMPFVEEELDIDESDPELLSSLRAAAMMSEYEEAHTPILEPSQSMTPPTAAIEPTPAMESLTSSSVVETMLSPEEQLSVQPPGGTNGSDDQQGKSASGVK